MACARGTPKHAMETPLSETIGQRRLVTWVLDQGRRAARHRASCKTTFASDNPVVRLRASRHTLAPREKQRKLGVAVKRGHRYDTKVFDG